MQTTEKRSAYQKDKDERFRKFLILKLSVRLWALWIPFIARTNHLTHLINKTRPPEKTPFTGLAVDTILRCCRKVVRRPILMSERPCLREGLLMHRFLSMAGYQNSLHFGVDRDSTKKIHLSAHCWIIVGDLVVNPPLPNMVEILKVSKGQIYPKHSI